MSDYRRAEEPDNPFTRLIHRVGQANAAMGRPAGRGYSPPPPSSYGDELPSARSAALGPVRSQPVPEPPPTPEQQAYYDRRLKELGLADDDWARNPEDLPPARRLREAVADAKVYHKQVQMPDFTKIEAIDIQHGMLVIDGLSFPIPEDEMQAIRGWAIEKAIDAITDHIARAALAMGLLPVKESPADAGTGSQAVEGGTETAVGPLESAAQNSDPSESQTVQEEQTRDSGATETPVRLRANRSRRSSKSPL